MLFLSTDVSEPKGAVSVSQTIPHLSDGMLFFQRKGTAILPAMPFKPIFFRAYLLRYSAEVSWSRLAMSLRLNTLNVPMDFATRASPFLISASQ